MLKRMAFVAATIGLVSVAGTPAVAATALVHAGCISVWGQAGGRDFQITINAPATATRGQTVTLTTAISETTPYPVEESAGRYQSTLEVVVGGASSGTVVSVDLVNPHIAKNTPFRLEGGHVRYTFNESGDVTFKPGIERRAYANGYTFLMCGSNTAPVIATTHVS